VNITSNIVKRSIFIAPLRKDKKYVLGEVERESNTAFDIGEYFHTAILEPHLLDSTVAFYDGKVRRGAAWEVFQEENKDKVILTNSDKVKGDLIIQAVKDSPVAMDYLEGTISEVSCFSEIWVDLLDDGQPIYGKHAKGQWRRLTIFGWTPVDGDIDTFGMIKIRIKVRADALKESDRSIGDLKSSSKNVKSEHEIKTSTHSYDYDLSAALYLDMFNLHSDLPYSKFVWIYASKTKGSAKTWHSTKEIIAIGRAKWMKAARELAKLIDENWEFPDEIGHIEPMAYEKEWLTPYMNEIRGMEKK
jgi:hypothetical protein